MLANEGIKKRNYSTKKRVIHQIKSKENNSSIATRFNKYGKKVSMFWTVKEVD